ncbi:hypothetical protein HDG38_005773 [Paraburkholderia sp. WSM4177]|nr:hypothetical protein [Paraburkholderia sp. WSM4177]MBB5487677.1 hypothetical protein [Paraburkholderia sp. WSM4180]
MFRSFDAFRDDFETQIAGECDDRTDNRLIRETAANAADERHVDLQTVRVKAAQVSQARVTGAKVVDRYGHANVVQGGKGARCNQASFGNLQFEPVRGQL